MTEIQRYADRDALAQAAAVRFVAIAQAAIDARGKFTVALSGGSTPKALHRLLASPPLVDQVVWDKVHVYWGDERTVPPDHSDSNYGMARQTLLDHVPIPDVQIHRMQGEIDPQEASKSYGKLIQAHFNPPDTRFDLVLLGMGDDGHTLSLFPGTAALHETKHRCQANYVPKLETWRITLTAHVINAAANVIFLVAGEGKSAALQHVLEGEYQPEVYPAQLIKPDNGTLVWMVDEAAGSQLT